MAYVFSYDTSVFHNRLAGGKQWRIKPYILQIRKGLFYESNIIWQLAGNLLTPVFDAGVRKRDIEIATIEQEQALLNYGKTALEAFSDVEKSLDQGQVLEKRSKSLLEVKTEINKAYTIADLRYREGEVELIDVLNIQQRLTDADSKIIALKRAQLEQRINLYLALGGEW